MSQGRTFYPRAESQVGQIKVPVRVWSAVDRSKQIGFDAMVDTGAFGLVLPLAWKRRLEPLPDPEIVEVETADQRVVAAEVCGPVRIQIDGFRRIFGEVVFLKMEPGPRGYEPLVGYTVLELCGAVVDMVSHRLVRRPYYDMRAAAARRATSFAARGVC